MSMRMRVKGTVQSASHQGAEISAAVHRASRHGGQTQDGGAKHTHRDKAPKPRWQFKAQHTRGPNPGRREKGVSRRRKRYFSKGGHSPARKRSPPRTFDHLASWRTMIPGIQCGKWLPVLLCKFLPPCLYPSLPSGTGSNPWVPLWNRTNAF